MDTEPRYELNYEVCIDDDDGGYDYWPVVKRFDSVEEAQDHYNKVCGVAGYILDLHNLDGDGYPVEVWEAPRVSLCDLIKLVDERGISVSQGGG